MALHIRLGARVLTVALLAALLVALPSGLGEAAQGSLRAEKHGQLWAYRGMSTWVDIFNWEPWINPRWGVAEMKREGVQTIYIETSRYTKDSAFFNKEALGRILEEAHDVNIRVVAWYLPGLMNVKQDFARSRAAIKFRSPRGDRFDAFALNLECDEIANITLRNKRAIRLSQRLKRSVPRSYGLGTIVVDPVHAFYWPKFPYRRLGRLYDVMMPMSYWTYREVFKARKVGRFVTENINAIRRATRGLDTKINVPGGIAKRTSLSATRAYVRALKRKRVLGGGLYDFSLMKQRQWPILRKLRVRL